MATVTSAAGALFAVVFEFHLSLDAGSGRWGLV
jgi:hypothetical protein